MEQTPAHRKMMLLAKELGMKRQDRIDFGNEICCTVEGERITSWTQLNDDQVLRVLDGMHGYILLRELLEHHRSGVQHLGRI